MRVLLCLNLLWVAALSACVGSTVTGPTKADDKKADDRPDRITAREIVLVDEDGKARVRIIAGKNASGLWVQDPDKSYRCAAVYQTPAEGSVLAVNANPPAGKGFTFAVAVEPGKLDPTVQLVGADGKLHSRPISDLFRR